VGFSACLARRIRIAGRDLPSVLRRTSINRQSRTMPGHQALADRFCECTRGCLDVRLHFPIRIRGKLRLVFRSGQTKNEYTKLLKQSLTFLPATSGPGPGLSHNLTTRPCAPL
jgi:hypothetical protein